MTTPSSHLRPKMQALLSQWWCKELHLWMLSMGSTKFSVNLCQQQWLHLQSCLPRLFKHLCSLSFGNPLTILFFLYHFVTSITLKPIYVTKFCLLNHAVTNWMYWFYYRLGWCMWHDSSGLTFNFQPRKFSVCSPTFCLGLLIPNSLFGCPKCLGTFMADSQHPLLRMSMC